MQAGTRSRKLLWMALAAVVTLVAAGSGVAYWYTQVKAPHDRAVAAFASATAALQEKNSALSSRIGDLESLVNSGDAPLDDSLPESAGALIGQSQAMLYEVPEMPDRTVEIVAAAQDMEGRKPFDAQIEKLASAQAEYSDSVKQMAQVTDPNEQFVIKRISDVPTVTGVQAATEENDPNGNLHKQGGYTAAVFFSSNLVDRSQLLDDGDIVTVGTDGGGSVEVYGSAEAATTRDEYLAAFDGSILSSGSHRVVGTCVVRTSHLLTASQQKSLEQDIVDALVRLD